MRRLQNIEKQLISNKQTLTFDHFASLPTLDRQDFLANVCGPNWEWRKKTAKVIEEHPETFPHFNLLESGREEKRQKMGEALLKFRQYIKLSFEEYKKDPNAFTQIISTIASYNLGLSIKNGVHFFLYVKTLMNLGTEIHSKFIQDSFHYKDVGCFGLTEILHGSNTRDLLTEAHYDHENRQFIMNTPSKEGMKFWIGAAAEVANMSVIWAQLFIGKKCYGIHAFIVPLRDKKTHKLFPGVLVGDCGPKNGNNEIDNGFILLDKVRIPVENLLNRISGIDKEGNFYNTVKTEDKRFGTHLGALSGGRFMISLNGTTTALGALAIGVRYSCLRRQFNTPPSEVENLLIQYPLTRRRLMPLLAQAIVYQMGNMDISYIWDSNQSNILHPQSKLMQDLHAVSSVIKPKTGWFSIQTIKECRQILGGHGYSSFSRLGSMYDDCDINNTWEGDNNVLMQQAVKYILNNFQKAMKGKPIDSKYLKFLSKPPEESQISFSEEKFLDLNQGLIFLQYKILAKTQDLGMKMMALKGEKKSDFDIWNTVQVYLGKSIALTFADLFYLQNALQKLSKFSERNQPIMKKIIQLWMLRVYRYDEFIDSVHHPVIQNLMVPLCNDLAKESLGILEAVSFGDGVIGSPFACQKGKGFEKYVKLVRESNTQNKRVDWWQILKEK